MLDALPPSLLFEWLTAGPMVFMNPEMLRLVSKRMQNLVDTVLAMDNFWQKYMRACFPSFGTRLPRQFAEKQLPENWAWRLFARRIISDFGSLHVCLSVSGKQKFDTRQIMHHSMTERFSLSKNMLVQANYLVKMVIKFRFSYIIDDATNIKVQLCTKLHKRTLLTPRQNALTKIHTMFRESGLNPEGMLNTEMDIVLYFSKMTPASIECWLDYLPTINL